MPKKRDNKTKRSIQRKFRIGNAKGGVSGHSVSTTELEELLKNDNKKRDWNNARIVLKSRGIAVDKFSLV